MSYYSTQTAAGKTVKRSTEEEARDLAQRSANRIGRAVAVFYHFERNGEERRELVCSLPPLRKDRSHASTRRIVARLQELVDSGMSVEDAAAQVRKEREQA